MRDRGESTRIVTWTIQLTLEELAVIEHALSRLSAEEIDPESARSQSATRALLSRFLGTAAPTSKWSDNGSPLSLDEDSLTVTVANEHFACKPTSFRVLAHLIHRRGRWIRSEELRSQVLATTFQQDASNIRWHVLQARRALGSRANWIHSDNRLGFMFDLAPCGRRHCRGGEGLERGAELRR